MKLIYQKWTLVVLLLLSTGLALVKWKNSGQPQFPLNVTLSDGSHVRLLAMEYGTNVFLTNVNVRQRICLWLPAKLRPRGFKAPPSFSFTTPALLLVYQDDKPSNNNREHLYFLLGVGQGFYGYKEWGFSTSLRDGSRNPKVFVFPNYPRRSRNFQLLVASVKQQHNSHVDPDEPFDLPGPVFVGQVSLRNKFISNAPKWVVQSLPIDRTVGELTVRLKDGSCATNFDKLKAESFLSDSRTTLELECYTGGHLDTNWEILSVESKTASGNQQFDKAYNSTPSMVFHPSSLWLEEPIQYRVELGRSANFPPNDVLSLSGVPIPVGNVSYQNFETNFHGQSVLVEGFADKLSFGLPGNSFGRNLSPGFRITVRGKNLKTQFKLIDAVNETGNFTGPIEASPLGGSLMIMLPKVEKASLGQPILPNAKTIGLKLGLQKSLYVDFVVQPRATNSK